MLIFRQQRRNIAVGFSSGHIHKNTIYSSTAVKTMWFKWGKIFPHRPRFSSNYNLSILKIQDLLSKDRLVSGTMSHVNISKKDVKNFYNMACVFVTPLFNTVMQAH